MADKLDDIWQWQAQLDNYIAEKYGLVYPQHLVSDGSPESEAYIQEEMSNWIVQMCLCLYSEVAELQNETAWKHWKPPTPMDREKTKMEMIDILFFTISALQKLNVTSEEAHAAFKEKFDENVARQQGKSKEGKNYGK